jgi:hypothetical protein
VELSVNEKAIWKSSQETYTGKWLMESVSSFCPQYKWARPMDQTSEMEKGISAPCHDLLLSLQRPGPLLTLVSSQKSLVPA